MSAPKILSVDDSRMIHSLIGKAFSKHDCHLLFASNGAEGLAVATREKPDVVILDVTMPVMDGFETLSRLKGDPKLKDIPVIMLTAEAGKENVMKIARIGVRDYIVKPFTEQLLVDRVGRVVSLQARIEKDRPQRGENEPVRMLLVEDCTTTTETIQRVVQSRPWRVTATSQISEAAQSAFREPPDVIVVSLSLPNKAGVNLLHLFRSNARTQHIPLVGLVDSKGGDRMKEATAAGCAQVLSKPLASDEALAAFESALKNV